MQNSISIAVGHRVVYWLCVHAPQFASIHRHEINKKQSVFNCNRALSKGASELIYCTIISQIVYEVSVIVIFE